MTPAYTVLLPHKLNPRNNDALSICLDCLARNSRHDYALLMSAAVDQPLYETMNRLVWEAPTDTCVFMHSDMFVAPSWDIGMLDVYNENTFVTGLLVEPGAIALAACNVLRNFGRRPETFRREDFEAWACGPEAPHASGQGWFAPYMFSRKRWLDLGGHDLTSSSGVVWTDLDIQLFDRHKNSGGRVVQAQAVVYHLQRWSEIEEQEAAKRQ